MSLKKSWIPSMFWTLALLTLLVSIFAAPTLSSASPDTRPNIIIFLADQGQSAGRPGLRALDRADGERCGQLGKENLSADV